MRQAVTAEDCGFDFQARRDHFSPGRRRAHDQFRWFAGGDAVRPYWEAGFTDVALVQIGGEAQDLLLKEVAQPLLEALRDASG